MARPLRLEFPGALYHIITARGNAQQPIFLKDGDRHQFIRVLGREVQQQHWRCYVYCLMGNHYHLVIETPEPDLRRGLRRLHGTYTQWFNRGHQRVGHLLQGRFKSLLVGKECYLQELYRYVVRISNIQQAIERAPRSPQQTPLFATSRTDPIFSPYDLLVCQPVDRFPLQT